MERIPLIEPPMQSMVLADGRQLDWQEFGAPDGRPALYFHGGGSISWEAGIFHREALHSGIRLIATNRPGAAGSSLCPGRPVAAYADDLIQLLDRLGVDTFACFGESNGGMVSLAVAATMANRVVGAVPINPTVPWFDPMARRVSPGSVAIAYRIMKTAPGILVWAAGLAAGRFATSTSVHRPRTDPFDPAHLIGPPPGTEPDVAALQQRLMGQCSRRALRAELEWAAADWGFDHYAIPVRLDLFCGVYDAQAPFALVLAERNPNARFHYAPFGHNGFSLPETRARIVALVAGYFSGR